MVHPIISERHITDGICSQQRLEITLHYLSQGGTMLNLAWAYQMGATTVHFRLYMKHVLQFGMFFHEFV
ncbi:hypothetical protein JTB14_010618 [Gonioctena quinquepunctata]|nr:hypothetical protein JTB14_010618 [Gonioctena quinquepunctata]